LNLLTNKKLQTIDSELLETMVSKMLEGKI